MGWNKNPLKYCTVKSKGVDYFIYCNHCEEDDKLHPNMNISVMFGVWEAHLEKWHPEVYKEFMEE